MSLSTAPGRPALGHGLAPWLALALAACAARQDPGPAMAELELTVSTPVVVAVTAAGATLRLDYRVDNPSALAATLRQASWRVSMGGQRVGSGQAEIGQPLAAGAQHAGSLTIEVPLAFRVDELVGRPSAGKVDYQLEGSFFADVGAGVEDEYVFGQRGALVAPALPAGGASAQAMRFGGTIEVRVAIELSNPNAFDVPLDELRYAVSIAGTEVARDTIGQSDLIGGSATLKYEVVSSLNPAVKPFAALATQLAGASAIPWAVSGELVVQGTALPFTASGEVAFSERVE